VKLPARARPAAAVPASPCSSSATSPDGVSHWGDTKVVASLAAAVVLLAAFAAVEIRSPHALLPVRLLRSRDRSGAYLIMLCVGTALFGMFFFLTVFVQAVWGYSALRTGVAYLPMMAAIMAMSAASAQLVPRIGARPLLTRPTGCAPPAAVRLAQPHPDRAFCRQPGR
jgi:predicted MFS family arabinose efflux permease